MEYKVTPLSQAEFEKLTALLNAPPSEERERTLNRMAEDPAGIYSSPAPLPRYLTKIGRNEPCPCGSGKKCKRCCQR